MVTKLDDYRCLATIDLDSFSGMAWGALWQWIRARRMRSQCLFDCLRFPLGTSGEPEVETSANELHGLDGYREAGEKIDRRS